MADDAKATCIAGCCIFLLLFAFISLITLFCSIHTIGPERQVIIHNLNGRVCHNGPQTIVLSPFREKEWRDAVKIAPLDYSLITHSLTGIPRHENGPQMFFLQPYEVLVSSQAKVLLKFDEYIKYVDRLTGQERVLNGPQLVVPLPEEVSADGVQLMAFLNRQTAVLVLNKNTGGQRLMESGTGDRNVFAPGPYEEILEQRSLIRIGPHEAVIVRDALGAMTIHNGSDTGDSSTAGAGKSFFLMPYTEIFEMRWSLYDRPGISNSGDTHVVTVVDLRSRKIFFQYRVATSDNVAMTIEGTIFWRVVRLDRMIATTADPEGDVWHHSRSALISAVSANSLSQFMRNFNGIAHNASMAQEHDGFHSDRGLEVVSLEVTGYQPVDEETRQTLQEVIRETTNRINRLQAQESENEVQEAALNASIVLEARRRELIETEAENQKLRALNAGQAEGMQLAASASAFMNGLNQTIPDIDSRIALYNLHNHMRAKATNMAHLASGGGTLFLTPADMNLRLQMPAPSSEER